MCEDQVKGKSRTLPYLSSLSAPASAWVSNGECAAAAVIARRGPLLDAGRFIDGLRESGAPSYDVFCRAWRAYMAREREAGLEAAAMDVIR